MISKQLYPLWIAVLAAVLTFGTSIHLQISDFIKIALINGLIVGLYYFWSIRLAHLRNLLSFMLLVGLISLLLLSGLSYLTIFIYLIAGLFGLLYHFGIPGQTEPFRRIPFLKNAIIAINWTLITFLVPMTYTTPIQEKLFYWGSFERAFLIFAITIPFDIADKNTDKKTALTTLVHLFGEDKSIIMAVWCLCFAFGIHVFQYGMQFNTEILISCFYFFEIILMILHRPILQRNWTSLIYEGSLLIFGGILALG